MAGSILVYGFGNPGRGDDGLGIALAEEIERRDLPDVQVETNYQLNAEDALLISEKRLVVFVDASKGISEGYALTRLQPSHTIGFTTHAMSPSSVLALCEELYQKSPETYLLEIAGQEWEMVERLSDKAKAYLQAALLSILSLLQERG
ncbi:MAG: hypothetical protein A2293_06405 [Elusimicrobia bacterium RIFOXYB2_FULL_49_7]|nr:MAG: hypothetical protein A2293_06405 [Elusimicrobia bacterium RIFOXYB2_FULL_49_7]